VSAAGATPYYPVGDTDSMGTGAWFIDPTSGEPAVATGSNGMFIIPAAPITTYTGTADGYTFDSFTSGSLPGMALFVAMWADEGGETDTGSADTGSADTGTADPGM